MNKQINPKDLFNQAQESIEQGWDLDDYSDTMWKLRNADWSFRKIAEWLTNKGIDCTHNQVYYILKQHAGDAETAINLDLEIRDEDLDANNDPDFNSNTY